MAINVYTPGCHLLCHDDVIGSRRVSYILYLTDPDRPWKAEWGGALRLYPTQTYTGDDGEVTEVASPDFSVSIPPAFNQLSFFAVQPGESFHDVEEVYARKEGEKEEEDGGRVRMAISGWYHIPQEGEDGYEEGLEQRLAEKSSLMQLQGKGDKYDLPQAQIQPYDQENGYTSVNGDGKQPVKVSEEDDDTTLTEQDLDFLLQYLAPTYLTPDTLSSLSSLFADESSLRLSSVLSAKFSSSLHTYISYQELHALGNLSTPAIEASTTWKVARPPHKHRFLFQQPSPPAKNPAIEITPLSSLLNTLLPSRPFRKWLCLATGLTLTSHNILARRFRRGIDYSLATGYNEDVSRLEITLGITPTKGWGDDEEGEDEEREDNSASTNGAKKTEADEKPEDADTAGVGGYEVYMAGGDDDDDGASSNDENHDGGGSDHGVQVPLNINTNTGARASGSSSNPSKAKKKADPAIYNGDDDGDDGVLFSMPAGWNRMSIVLRDRGVLRFVKYVSAGAGGDRWDLCGEWRVEDEDEDEEEVEEGEEEEDKGGDGGSDEEEEEEEEGLTDGSDESSD